MSAKVYGSMRERQAAITFIMQQQKVQQIKHDLIVSTLQFRLTDDVIEKGKDFFQRQQARQRHLGNIALGIKPSKSPLKK